MLKCYWMLVYLLGAGSLAVATEAMEAPALEKRALPSLQSHKEDPFTSDLLKIQARLEGRIDENNRIINRLRSNFEEEIKSWIPRNKCNSPEKLGECKQKYQQVLIEILQKDNVFFNSLIQTKLIKFHTSVDEFLYKLHVDCILLHRDIEAHQRALPGRDDTVKDDLAAYRYIINKLSPYQFGWFRYVQASTQTYNKGGQFAVNLAEIGTLYEKELRKFLDDIPKYSTNERVSSYIAEKINQQFTTLLSKKGALLKQLDLAIEMNISAWDVALKLKNLAIEYGKFDCLYRQFRTPVMIAILEKQYPVEKKEESIIVPSGNKTENQDMAKTPGTEIQGTLKIKEEATLETQQTQQDAQHSIDALSTTLTESSSEVVTKMKEGATVAAKLTLLDLRKQRRAEKEEQQRRAKLWSGQLYEDHLSMADLQGNRDLTSEFDWMNKIINPDITITYQSIQGKLNSLATIKNGSGSRRHFLIKNTPAGRPIACYFHEPHPDIAVKIEKWRENISETLKKAGYFEFKK